MSTAKPFWYEARKGWYLWVTGANGKRSRVRLADSKEQAFRIWKASLRHAEQTAAGDPAFLTIATAWLERQEARLARGEVSKQWVKRVCRTVARFSDAHRGITAREVSPLAVQKWIGSVSANYERTELGTLKQCLKWAADNGLIEQSPLAAMRLAPTESRQSTVSREDHEKLIRACGDSKFAGVNVRCFRQLLITAWLSGCRPGELRLLMWGQIQADFSCAKLANHKTKRKTGKPRVVYFSICAQTLLRIKQHWQTDKDTVFPNSRGRKWTKDAVVRRMRRLREKTGIKAVAYSYRHGFATRALVSGVDSITVAELMGHTSIAMIQRHYAHLDRENQHLLSAVNKLNQ